MADDSTTQHAAGFPDDDPRLSGEYVRVIDGDAMGTDERDRGSIALVGVVHDHPASSYRVRRILSSREPEILALEAPPLAAPLFERYAERGEGEETDEYDTGATGDATAGGEMSAAIRAADAEVVGIDGPSAAFALRLARHLVGTRAAPGTVRTAVKRFARASGHALRCRLAAALADVKDVDPALSTPRTHAVTASDPAAAQARDERRQVRLARSVAAAFGADRSVATRDETREAHMASRLAELAAEGDVVAVIGVDHLGSVAERLENDCGT